MPGYPRGPCTVIPGASNTDLPLKVRKRGGKKKEARRTARLAKGESTETRPQEVNEREEIGHWEMDTVLSAKEGSLERVLALMGRATRNQINITSRMWKRKAHPPPWITWGGSPGPPSFNCAFGHSPHSENTCTIPTKRI